jgi:hypothetical protein
MSGHSEFIDKGDPRISHVGSLTNCILDLSYLDKPFTAPARDW